MVKNDSRVLTQAPLSRSDKAAFDAEFFAKNAKHLLTILTFFTKHPVKYMAGLYKAHVEILALVLLAVRKTKPIDREVSRIEANIKEYTTETRQLIQRAREIPSNPWDGSQLGGSGLATVLLLPALATNPRFIQEFNQNVDTYQRLVETALDKVATAADVGREIERVTPQGIKDIRDEIQKVRLSSPIDAVLLAGYNRRLEWMELNLITKVQDARSGATDATAYLRQCLQRAQSIQRL